jgi:hypothetical protein
MKKFCIFALALAVFITAALLIWNHGPMAPSSNVDQVEQAEPRSMFVVASGAEEQPLAPNRTLVSGRDADATPQLVTPCFWYYVSRLRGLPDVDARQRELAVRARQLRAFPPEELKKLGVHDLEAMSYEFEVGLSGSGNLLASPLYASLMRHWTKIANETGEPFADALIELFSTVALPQLADADLAMLDFSASALAYLRSEQDMRRYVPLALDAVRGLPTDRPFSIECCWPPIRVISGACSRFAWPRRDALQLLDAAWMEDALRSAFLVMMVCGTQYSDWSQAIDSLLASADSGKAWAAIEALRYFVGGNGLSPERLAVLVPDAFFRSEDSVLLMATIELLTTYGGVEGERRLLALLYDDSYKSRAVVLNFLAMEGKAPLDVCFQFLAGTSVELRKTALFALGHMSKVSDEAFAAVKRAAESHPDAAMRVAALEGLASSGRDIMAILDRALMDPDLRVQLEAVRQIGLDKSNQGERLAGIAANLKVEPSVRRLAYEELFLDATNEALPDICERMLADPDEQISGSAYLLNAALALGGGDAETLAKWEQLEIPSWVLKQHSTMRGVADGALGDAIRAVAGGGIRREIAARIQFGIDQILDPRSQQAFDEQRLFLTTGSAGESSLLRRMNASEQRVLAYLRSLRQR